MKVTHQHGQWETVRQLERVLMKVAGRLEIGPETSALALISGLSQCTGHQ